MAEPLMPVPPRAGGSEPEALLAAKLRVPRLRPGFVPRPRLVERLTDGLGRDLVLLCTPAGFGKTSLMADWARHSRRSVAWLWLDAGDNDQVRFWRHVAAALEGVHPGVAGRVAALRRLPGTKRTGWPMTPCSMLWPPEMLAGPLG